MAVTQLPQPPEVHRFPQPPEVHRFPQYGYVDAVRWLPPISALDRHAVIAFVDADTDTYSVEIHSLNPQKQPKELTPVATWNSPSRISRLKTTQFGYKPIVVAPSWEGSLYFLGASEDGALAEIDVTSGIHVGRISGVDVVDNGEDCVTVGEDGRVNLVTLGISEISSSRFFDSNGLVSYTAVKWASPSEFATGGPGFGLQWWDKRKPEGPVSQFRDNWAQGGNSGMILSMDIHPSRKHTCVAGGTSGSIFAWDLRWPQLPVVLSGAEIGGPDDSVSESDVWEVQFDRYDRILRPRSSVSSSSRVLPVVMGSEDGILAVVEQDEESVELLSEPWAINCFDIDKQNPADIICGMEWEGIAIVSRQ